MNTRQLSPKRRDRSTEPEERIRGSGHICACAHFDRYVCANMRYQSMDRFPTGEEFDPCDCGCHDDYDDEQDEEDWLP